MYDIIIIGAGPAGLTSAIYALRGGKKVLIIDKTTYGGQIINASLIENYPGIMAISGFSYAQTLYQQVLNLKGEFLYADIKKVTKEKIVYTNKGDFKAKALIIATGLENRTLDIRNSDKYLGRGLSYCATCDGNFYQKKVTAVYGGGSTALEEALYLSNISSLVYVIYRHNTFKGENIYLEQLKQKDNVKFILNTTIKELRGKDKLEEIVLQGQEKKRLKIDGLFVAIGKVPNNTLFQDLVDLDQNGFIITHDDVETKTPGIYAAGDVRQKSLRQLVTAVSDGAIASSKALAKINEDE